MLVFTPLGLASQSLGWGQVATFGLCFLAIIPLAKLLGEATEQLSCSVGQTLGGLLNATFGNAVEMIISVFALREGLTEVVKGSLVGSIISNLLLVLGMCFFCGGLNYQTQRFNANGARTQYSLLLLAILALVIPTVVLLTGVRPESELLISRGCAIVLAVLYLCYLIFQLVTHKEEFAAAETETDAEEEQEEASLSPGTALVLLVVATLLVAPLSEALTGRLGSVEGVTKTLNISDAFVGVVLLPIVGNAAEHLTAVTVATKDKMDLSLGVALGSSTQIALFVVPFTVIVGWFLGVPMDLNFRSLDVSILLLTVLIVGSTIVDGESNWLEGTFISREAALRSGGNLLGFNFFGTERTIRNYAKKRNANIIGEGLVAFPPCTPQPYCIILEVLGNKIAGKMSVPLALAFLPKLEVGHQKSRERQKRRLGRGNIMAFL
eukprot:symbB.v1.2.026175.t1/scaffold2593.1/size75360/8